MSADSGRRGVTTKSEHYHCQNVRPGVKACEEATVSAAGCDAATKGERPGSLEITALPNPAFGDCRNRPWGAHSD